MEALDGGGGDHASGSGGYSAGGGDNEREPGENGGASSLGASSYQNSGGSGYYERFPLSKYDQPYFNQGGLWQGDSSDTNTANFCRDHSGSGGTAGAGGNIYYTDINNIHAYNGNRITNVDFDYSTTCYEYDKNGNLTSQIANVVIREDGKKIIPALIFGQSGVSRAVYKTNQHMTQEEANSYNTIYVVWENRGNKQTRNVLISEEHNINTTSYGQGIGSGAGYLEQSNGSFTLLN